MIDPELYRTLDRWAVWVLGWIAVWALWTAGKTLLHLAGREVRFSKHMVLTELPGLPLMLLHSVGFVLAFLAEDWLSLALLAWWGPGYLLVVALVLTRGKRIDWRPWASLTSWGCKLSYVAVVGVFAWQGLWTIPFAFSAWIINDQIRLAWFEGNADRTRRTTEDLWLPRVLYPGLLLVPCFAPIPGGWAAAGLGLAQLLLWAGGIAAVVRRGTFRRRPDPGASDNLRDIVYLRREPQAATPLEPAP